MLHVHRGAPCMQSPSTEVRTLAHSPLPSDRSRHSHSRRQLQQCALGCSRALVHAGPLTHNGPCLAVWRPMRSLCSGEIIIATMRSAVCGPIMQVAVKPACLSAAMHESCTYHPFFSPHA